VDLYIHSSSRLHGVVLNYVVKYRENFAFYNAYSEKVYVQTIFVLTTLKHIHFGTIRVILSVNRSLRF
jgi:hypothetical protein